METSQQKVRTTPKDFFLYFATMAGLYVSVVSLITLLFQCIEALFPDALDVYRDPYSSGIRFAIASLIIVFPIYLVLTRVANNHLRRNPEKRDVGIRKWLIYLTLFVAGVAIVIDLIMLVNTFLGGEITIRFVLKVLAVLLVVGAVFGYYWQDLRGKWERDEKLSKRIGMTSAVLVLAVIIGGFFIMGTPMEQRLIRFDQQKISDLQNIQYQITTFWQQKQKLPTNLEELEDPLTGFILPKDPQSGESYVYKVSGVRTFELCASFNKKSNEKESLVTSLYYYPELYGVESANWAHEEGETCFSRTIDPDKFPALRKI
jgi:hypothetical protein